MQNKATEMTGRHSRGSYIYIRKKVNHHPCHKQSLVWVLFKLKLMFSTLERLGFLNQWPTFWAQLKETQRFQFQEVLLTYLKVFLLLVTGCTCTLPKLLLGYAGFQCPSWRRGNWGLLLSLLCPATVGALMTLPCSRELAAAGVWKLKLAWECVKLV